MKYLLFVFTLVFALSANSQEPVTSEADLKGELQSLEKIETILPGLALSEENFDFGTVYFGGSVEHTFTITNTGETPVAILNMRTDCGCKSTRSSDEPLQPGESQTIKVVYEPEYKTGKVEKRVTIYTDIAENNSPGKWFELTLTAEIKSVLSIVPGHVFFKKVNAGEASTESIMITATKEAPNVKVSDAVSSSEHLGATLKPAETEKGMLPSWILELELKESAPVGRFSETVTLTTSSEDQKEITIDIMGYVRGQVQVRPTQSYLGTLSPGDVIEKSFRVTHKGKEPNLEAPTIPETPSWMTYEIVTDTEKASYTIKATFIVPEDLTGRFGGTFTVHVGHETLDKFEIPVFGYVLAPESDNSSSVEETP